MTTAALLAAIEENQRTGLWLYTVASKRRGDWHDCALPDPCAAGAAPVAALLRVRATSGKQACTLVAKNVRAKGGGRGVIVQRAP